MSFRQNNSQEVYQYSFNSQSSYGHHSYLADGNGLCSGEESNFWTNGSPRSDTPSPSVVGRNPYHTYANLSFTSGDVCQSPYRTGCNLGPVSSEADSGRPIGVPFVRVVKRRTTANKKERRRTQSINNAYAELRDRIPNVPSDTKLSKIKTLRLATSYISHLMAVLETGEPAGSFKVELNTSSRRTSSTPIQTSDCPGGASDCDIAEDPVSNSRRAKGRTGWPQHVWALELKQEQTL